MYRGKKQNNRREISSFRYPFFAVLLILFSLGLFAQPGKIIPPPTGNFETPYEAVYSHLYYLQDEHYSPERAAQALFSTASEDSSLLVQYAVQLKQIYDGMGLLVNLTKIPRDSNWVDSVSGTSIFSPFPQELPAVFLQRQADNKWYYSAYTTSRINKLHASVFPFGMDTLLHNLPPFSHTTFLGLAIWQYAGFILVILLLGLLHFFLRRLLGPILHRLSHWQKLPSLIDNQLLRKIAALASLVILLWLFRLLVPALQLPVGFNIVLIRIAKLINLILLALAALRMVEVLIRYATRYTEQTESKLDEQLMPILKRALQGGVILAAAMQGFRLLDVDITALIAGISIGGLAIALAAQDTMKNLIGSITIFTDQPFQIGDWIEGSGFSGTVVEVGFRTTRLRRPDSSIISVPNGSIVNMNVQNLGVRKYRLLEAVLGLTYDTRPALIEQYVQGLHRLVEAHPKTDEGASFIFFRELADSSLNISMRVPILTNDYREELQVKEEIFLGVLRLAETLGVSFAFPSTSLYVESTPQHPVQPRERLENGSDKINDFIEKFKQQVTRPPAPGDNQS